MSTAPVTAAPHAQFEVAEYEGRFHRIRQEMEGRQLDAIVVTGKENSIYFSGLETVGWSSKHRPVACILPLDGDQPILVVPESLEHVAAATSWIGDVRLWGGYNRSDIASDAVGAINEALSSLKTSKPRIGLELGYGTRLGMTIDEFDVLRSSLSDAEIVDGAAAVWALRMIKSPAEVDRLRKACLATCDAFEIGLKALQPGASERDIAAVIFAEMSRQTGYPGGFLGIRSGPLKYSMMNVPPFGSKELAPGELVVIDGGAVYGDYWCDMMRMGCVGEPTVEQQRLFDIDLSAMNAGLSLVKPGARAGDIPQACLDVLHEAGLAKYVPTLERVGHGLGLEYHEPPSLALGNDAVLEEGMVLAVEPIFSDRPDFQLGNFAMEQNVVVTADGYDLLTPLWDGLWTNPITA